jgi:hypothetical protein
MLAITLVGLGVGLGAGLGITMSRNDKSQEGDVTEAGRLAGSSAWLPTSIPTRAVVTSSSSLRVDASVASPVPGLPAEINLSLDRRL